MCTVGGLACSGEGRPPARRPPARRAAPHVAARATPTAPARVALSPPRLGWASGGRMGAECVWGEGRVRRKQWGIEQPGSTSRASTPKRAHATDVSREAAPSEREGSGSSTFTRHASPATRAPPREQRRRLRAARAARRDRRGSVSRAGQARNVRASKTEGARRTTRAHKPPEQLRSGRPLGSSSICPSQRFPPPRSRAPLAEVPNLFYAPPFTTHPPPPPPLTPAEAQRSRGPFGSVMSRPPPPLHPTPFRTYLLLNQPLPPLHHSQFLVSPSLDQTVRHHRVASRLHAARVALRECSYCCCGLPRHCYAPVGSIGQARATRRSGAFSDGRNVPLIRLLLLARPWCAWAGGGGGVAGGSGDGTDAWLC